MSLSNIVKKGTLDKKKKKKSFLARATSFLSNKLMKPAYKSGTKLANNEKIQKFAKSDEGKALAYTLSHPKEVVKAGGENVKKVGDKLVNNNLQKSGRDTLMNSFKTETGNVMKPVGNLIKSTGEIFTGVADTTDTVKELGKKVREGKLSTGDAIIEAASTVGLQGVGTLAAPYTAAIGGAFKQLGVEKKVEKLLSSGQTLLEDAAVELFSDGTEKSKNKIISRTRSVINAIQAGTMFKGMKILGKANKATKLSTKLKETAKGGATMGAVPITLTVLGAVAGEEGKKMPNPDKLGAVLGQTASALAIPTKMKGIKLKQTPKTIRSGKVELEIADAKKGDKLSNQVKNKQLSLDIKGNLKNKLSDVPKVKKVPLTKEQKTQNKLDRNLINQINGLQELKRNGEITKISSKDTSLGIKKEMINEAVSKGLMKENGIDNGYKSYTYTEKGYELGGQGKGVHVPNEIVNKSKPLSKKVTKKKLDIPKTKKGESVDIFAKNKKGEIEPAVVKDSPTGQIDNLDIINDIKKGDVILKKTTKALSKNDTVRKTGSAWINNLGGVLKNIAIKTKEGLQTLSETIDGIKGESEQTLNKTLDRLGFNEYKKIETRNTKAINEGEVFVKKNIDTFFPGEDLKSRIIKYITLKDDNNVFNRTPSKKGTNTTKARVILNAVYGKTKLDIKNLEQSKRESIDKLDIPKEEKTQLKKEIEITPTEQAQILEKNIKLLPKETQKFVREVDQNFSLFKENSKLKEGFKELGEDLEAEGIVFKKGKDYMHGYVNRDTLKKFSKELEKEGINVKDFDDITLQEMMGEKISTPEQMTNFLKKKKDAWALHSNNPLDVMMSYANEYTKLTERKTINKLLDKIASADKDAGEYLKKELHDEHSFMYKKLLDMHEAGSTIGKAGKKVAKGLAVGTYIGNTKMIPQNVTFAGVVGGAKYLTNLITGKGTTVKNKHSDLKGTREYLFEQGLLSHKDFNIDKKFTGKNKGNVSLSKKIALNVKDSPNKAMRLFTASFVPQIQSIVGQSFMAKVVKDNGGVRGKETIPEAYKRVLDTKPTSERIKIRGELAKVIKDIEDSTYSNTATTKALDIPLFNMIKSFSRGNLQKIKEDITDITELANSKEYGKFNKELKTRAGTSAADLFARTYGLYAVLQGIAAMLPGTDDEKEKFVNYTFAESMEDYLTNLALSPVGMPGVNILSNDVLNSLAALYKVGNTDDNELRKKYLGEFAGSYFTGLRNMLDVAKNANATYLDGEHTTHESGNGGFAYKNTDSSNPLYAFMGINPTSAAYSNMYKKLEQYKSDLPRDFLDKWEDFSRSNRILRNYTNSANKLRNAEKYAKVETALKKMTESSDKKVTQTEWINDILGGASDEVKKVAYESFEKAKKDSSKELSKLLNIGFDIAGKKKQESTKGDFNKTLKALAVANPRAYEDFMQVVLGYYTYPNGAPSKEMKNKNADFISNLVSQYTNSAKMSTTIANQVSNTLKKVMKYKYSNQGEDKDIQKELNELTKIVDIIKESPELYNQVKESIAELAKYNFNSKDRRLLRDTIDGNPLLKELYEQGIENRGGVLEKEKENDILEEDNNTNKEDLGMTQKETATGKKGLADLVKMKYQKLIDEKQIQKSSKKNEDLHLKALEILMKK